MSELDLRVGSDEREPESDPPAVEEPRPGTLAWLALKPHEDWFGIEVPVCNRIPPGATRATEPSTRCQVLKENGERCSAVATRRYGICVVHAGGGGAHDIREMSARGHAAKSRLRVQRQLLGIGPARAGSARQRARLRAAARADEIAAGIVDGVLDAGLEPLQLQAAALRILDATEPLQHTTVEVELPADAAGVQGMDWQQMQALAAQLLSEG